VATNGTQGTLGKYNVASAQETAQNERAIVAEAAEASVAASGADERFETPRGKAFFVATDDYGKSAPPLPGARRDVESLAARFVQFGFAESDITVLKTGGGFEDYPLKRNIEKRFEAFVRSLEPGDFAFVYLSGRGVQASDSNEAFFVPIDVEPSDPLGTSVSIDAMTAALEKSDAKFRCLVVDACRNDPNNPDKSLFGVRALGAKDLTDPISAPDSTSVLQSCEPGRSSFEVKDGNGLLTMSLLEALDQNVALADANGDGALGFGEMVEYVTARTDALAREHFNAAQKPTLSGQTEDFILMAYGDLSTEDWRRANALYLEGSALRKEKRWTEAAAKIGEALEIAELEACRWEAGTIAEVLALQEAAKEAEAAFKAAETAFRTAEEAASKAKGKRGDVPPPPTGGWSNAPAGTLKTLKVDGIAYNFRYCPSGTFQMGSPESEKDRGSDETQHMVELTNGFWMLETEVTVGMWRSFVNATNYKMGPGYEGKGGRGYNASTGKFEYGSQYTWDNPGFSQTDAHPVTQVDWVGAKAFCDWLSKESGLTIRLPSEAEWEYACRAGSRSAYSFGTDAEDLTEYGNVADASAKRKFTDWSTLSGEDGYVFTAPVKTFKPNEWKLYDMHGNVWEWCEDCYDAKYYEKSNNVQSPINVTEGSYRVLRGGSWSYDAGTCRSAHRFADDPTNRYLNFGFRLALVRSSSSSK
ncbi:MAG: SUMF1/EgtB/PvdO family nonheme iron enzyme, partial [Thermoguttaceae bacterium]|nr:SUMF1/EgtB/PvdO family nonheme iron enzyme [Thermoguttaceae bacterium]